MGATSGMEMWKASKKAGKNERRERLGGCFGLGDGRCGEGGGQLMTPLATPSSYVSTFLTGALNRRGCYYVSLGDIVPPISVLGWSTSDCSP